MDDMAMEPETPQLTYTQEELDAAVIEAKANVLREAAEWWLAHPIFRAWLRGFANRIEGKTEEAAFIEIKAAALQEYADDLERAPEFLGQPLRDRQNRAAALRRRATRILAMGADHDD